MTNNMTNPITAITGIKDQRETVITLWRTIKFVNLFDVTDDDMIYGISKSTGISANLVEYYLRHEGIII